MRVFSASILRTALLTIGLWAGAPTMSAAHEGHDHGNEAQASPTTTAPRGSSRTEALELVAIARNGRLAVFLDRVGTNEPVLDATIQAETPEGAATGTPMPDGSYGFDAHWSLHPGEHEVLFTVTASGASDVFPVTLTVPEPPPEPPAAGASAWAAGLAAAHDFQRHLKDADPLPLAIGGIGFLLGSVVTLLMRGRRYLPATALVVLVVALDNIRQQPEALKAPVDGVIAEASAVAGQMASPGVQVFQIVDPSRLWVEALSFDAVAGGQDATARMADGRMLRLAYMGAGLADRSQAVPMHFAVEGAPPELRTGQFVTVLAETDAQQKGLALPRTSVVRGGNGQSIVYEHTAPERFEPREVRVEPLDASRVLVVSGVAPGKRIVTQGAELLNQVR